jgi:hypothetical protein
MLEAILTERRVAEIREPDFRLSDSCPAEDDGT